MNIRPLKIFLSRYPRMRVFQRRVRARMRAIPAAGRWFATFEKNIIAPHASERYRADDPADAHEYFNSYAQWIVSQVPGGDVLDIGCGHGFLTAAIGELPRVRKAVGVDKIAPEEFLFRDAPKITYVQADISRMDALPGLFDAIVSTEFIEHIPLEACDRLFGLVAGGLRPGGVFLGSTPLGLSVSPYHEHEFTGKSLRGTLQRHFADVYVEALSTDCLVWRAGSPQAKK
jgi:2-polyprenyl-3-methyl-5-hydroxy-6-metoxy-1,4-benzoquinol methylase